ncbi:MAG: chemotaxis protein CheR [Nitrospirae bacterium]|nr:chemotaxis protein CheR [Nitrospirota bacterium]
MPLISPDILSRLSEFITSATGLSFTETQLPELERRMGTATVEFGFNNTEAFISWLLSTTLTKKNIETLASHLTVGETYFFRDSMSFKVLEETILPQIIHEKLNAKHGNEKHLRIWSAGCSTGEEPYSIAILLNRTIPDIKNWNITILATDINTKFINRASEGIYGEWSFRETPDWIKERYFRNKAGGKYEILPFIKKMVTFSYLNLADDIYPSLLNNTNAMDLIFSRNVLMYLTDECSGKVINGFANSLVEGGFLFSSPTDPVRTLSARFTTINFPEVILYKKGVRVKAEGGQGAEARSQKLEVRYDESEARSKKSEVRYDESEERSKKSEARSKMVEEIKTEEISLPFKGRGRVGMVLEEASSLFKSGQYSEAINELCKLISHEYDNPEAYPLIIRAYANQGMLDEALVWCKKAVSEEVVNPAYHYLTATVLLEKGRTEEAVRSLKNALYLDPRFVIPYFLLGNIMLIKGNIKSANKYFKNASDLSSSLNPDEVLPESDGMTAGRMVEIVGALVQ